MANSASLSLCWKAAGSGPLGTLWIPGQGAPKALGQGSAPVLWRLLQFVGTDCGSVGLVCGVSPECAIPPSLQPCPAGREGQGAQHRGGGSREAQGTGSTFTSCSHHTHTDDCVLWTWRQPHS